MTFLESMEQKMKRTLSTSARQILDKTIPTWIQRLCAADFSKDDLSYGNWDDLKKEAKTCAVGEAWDWTDAYNRNSDGESTSIPDKMLCNDCRKFSFRIPDAVGDSFVDFECSCGAIDAGNDDECNCTREDPIKVLNAFARHINAKHPELMNKDKIPNDC